MAIENPKTINEWKEYISDLTGGDLLNQAVTAATVLFAEKLEEEKYSASDITKIRLAYAEQLVLDGQGLPSFTGEAGINYQSLMNNPIYDIDDDESEDETE
tara:strand:- start:194 stop:496 length:303 start_codon:yes stop_codon:yes gene_type:complete